MATNGELDSALSGALESVLKPSDPVPQAAVPVSGLEFDDFAGRDVTVAELVNGMTNMGFQASGIGEAVRIVDGMVCMLLQTTPHSMNCAH